MSILYFIIALGILVFIHEFGHFIMAKKQGIGVEKFSLGFGPKLFGFTRGETTYLVSALPLGGYVKLMGEDPAEAESTLKDPRSYAARPLRQKFRVVFAGPFMNLLLALLAMPVVFMISRYEPAYLDQKPVVLGVKKDSPAQKAGLQKGDEVMGADGQTFSTWKDVLDYTLLHAKKDVDLKIRRGEEVLSQPVTIAESEETRTGTLGIEPGYFIGNEPVIDEVSPESPAFQGGMKAGDLVVAIDQVPINSWTDMSENVDASDGKALSVTVRRGGEMLTLSVMPRFDKANNKWLMGVKKDMQQRGDFFVKKSYPFGEAVVRGTRENIKLSGLTFSVLGRLVTGKLSYKTLGGPIRIAQASAMAAKSGLADFIYFICFLSLQLGILNLLPIPALDGGHLLFFGIEAIQRKPLSMKVRGTMEQAGFFFLLFLMLIVTLNDVDSVWGFRGIVEKVRHLF